MWLYGTHAALAALANPKRKVRRIAVTREALGGIEPHVEMGRHPKWEIVDAKALAKWLGEAAVHQGVALDVEPLVPFTLEDILSQAEGRPIVVLDQVTDPHNVGAILRSAAAFDVAAVVVQDRHSPELSGVLAKSASGALDIVPVVEVVNIAKTLDELKQGGYWVAGLDGAATAIISQAKLNHKTVLVLGAEGKGLRRLVGEHCDILVRLPISEKMESLNVSNAAAVALYELTR